MHGVGRGWEAALDAWTQGRKVWFPRKELAAAKDGSRAGMQGFARRQEAVLLSWLEAGMAPESWAHLGLVFLGSFSSSPEAGGSWSSTLGPTGDACMGCRGSSCPALASSKADKSLVTMDHAGHPPARCRSHPHKWPSSLCQPLV